MAPSADSKLSSSSDVTFTLNGETHTLDENVPLSTTLLEYVRNFANLRGTKSLCREGGCGVCTVVATTFDLEKATNKTFSVRSCQTLVYSCVGWVITTIEHLGNSQVGYDRLQVALKEFYGTQCGYCSPGFIMAMHGLLQKSSDLTVAEVEMAFDGNICRCTGYRPILDAFKSFAKDAPKELKNKLVDIEDAYKKRCSKTGKLCSGKCSSGVQNGCSSNAVAVKKVLNIVRDDEGTKWCKPNSLEGILTTIQEQSSTDKIRLVVGNTGQGVFKEDGPYDLYIDTSGVKELYATEPSTLTIGANISLNRCIEIFHNAAKNQKGYHHLEKVAQHWEIVANTGIRNIACWAGNLMMKFHHHDFCSDIFTTLLAVEAKLKIATLSWSKEVSLEEFLTTDMSKSVIVSMSVPPQPENVLLRTFKITPRAVNAHAYVNAAFKFHVDFVDNFRVVNMPSLIFSGINPKTVRANKTEKYFVGKQLSNQDDVSKAIEILGKELEPNLLPQYTTPKHRRSLSQSLLYKSILCILGKSTTKNVGSGGSCLERPISSGKQVFDENKDSWPIGQAIPKLESETQLSGEAEYLDDVPFLHNELHGVFVQSTIANGTIKSIKTDKCLKMPGVVDFITAMDIPPGKNNFMLTLCVAADPIFAENKVNYFGQGIGLVVAKTRRIAENAAKLVEVTYENVVKPTLEIKDCIKENRSGKAINLFTGVEEMLKAGNDEAGFKESKHILEGEFSQGSQFHMTTEALAARVVPREDGYDLFCTTQFIRETQNVVANVLGVPVNTINMQVKRIGGGFGGKVLRPSLLAGAAAAAAKKLHKPVRVVLTLTDHMTLIGWREPFFSKYKVGFNEKGELKSIKADMYSDGGFVNNETSSPEGIHKMPNAYHCPNWRLDAFYALTDTAANTACRAPGVPQGIALMETILDRIADFLNLDPILVRERNLLTKEKPETIFSVDEAIVADKIFPLLKKSSEIEKRKIEIQTFNKNNRWKKRGIAMIPTHYPIGFDPFLIFNVQVAIYEHDGTVSIKHGGIEMGQGINTKVAQVAAKILGVPLEIIRIKVTDNFSGANSSVTGGSMGSDMNAHGVKICCERIKARMDVVAKEMGKDCTWVQLVKKCFQLEVDISERYMTKTAENPDSYHVWAAAVTEVELDVLTGQFLLMRTDIMEDCGRSMSPQVDIGQIEGAFIMGVGFVTAEKVKFDPATGQKLSNGTWEYKVPTALDIPVDMRVTIMPKGDNPKGVVRSKATGEPAFCLGFAVVSALREAIKSARKDSGLEGWFDLDTPLTVDAIHELCNVKPSQFTL